jgi:hypothetical protein
MISGAGLTVGGKPPDCFLEFLEHAAVVRMAVREGIVPPEDIRPHYPPELDDEVEKQVAWLRRRLGISHDGRRPWDQVLDRLRRGRSE